MSLLITVKYLNESRNRRLYDDLSFALARTDLVTLQRWGGRSAGRLLTLGAHRIGGLAMLVSNLGQGAWQEITGLVRASGQGAALPHLGDRTAAAIDGSIAIGREGGRILSTTGRALVTTPKEAAPRVLAAVLGFYAGSGGVDGNGGIPDLDLLAGIDAHRALLTHSILAGVIAEGLLLSIADLAQLVYERLPLDHDPLWDALAKAGAPLTASLAAGTSAGIAYHLLIDAFIQPAPYHGLPFSMPMEGHQALMGANGLAEGIRTTQRPNHRDPIEIQQDGLPEKTVGRKVVDGFANAADWAKSAVSSGWSHTATTLRGFRKSGK